MPGPKEHKKSVEWFDEERIDNNKIEDQARYKWIKPKREEELKKYRKKQQEVKNGITSRCKNYKQKT